MKPIYDVTLYGDWSREDSTVSDVLTGQGKFLERVWRRDIVNQLNEPLDLAAWRDEIYGGTLVETVDQKDLTITLDRFETYECDGATDEEFTVNLIGQRPGRGGVNWWGTGDAEGTFEVKLAVHARNKTEALSAAEALFEEALVGCMCRVPELTFR